MIPYILHVSLILAACLSFYKILLQRETFYQANRFVLIACLLLSFSLPLIPVPQQWSLRKADVEVVVNSPELLSYSNTSKAEPTTVQAQSPATVTQAASTGAAFDFQQIFRWPTYLYWFGVAAFTISFLVQLASLLGKVYCNPVIKDGPFRIVELPGDKAPCSFGNIIFINPEKYDWDTYNQILLHEKIHIQQQHSIDILLAEIVLIFQWFNPFAWLYRKELENNLEFLTDDMMLTRGEVDATSYQMNLLKVSAPHFPLSLTTNYNQSLLKKRVVMMNAKKSNVNTTWKYIFLLPVLIASVCLLNQPTATAKPVAGGMGPENKSIEATAFDMKTEGVWFATIKNDKISIQFKNDDDGEKSMNSTTFPLSDFKDLPREKQGTFSLTREPGTMQFTGKFDGEQGMGRYKFTADKQFGTYLSSEGIEASHDQDLMVFFMVDVKKSYVQMLKSEGYTSLTKNDLIPLAALHIDAPFINSMKQAGFKDFSVHDLIPLKSLGVDRAFIQEIRNAGYQDVSVSQLITFKAQGINGKYIADVRNAAKGDGRPGPEVKDVPEVPEQPEVKERPEMPEVPERPEIREKGKKKGSVNVDADPSIDDIVAIKALGVDPAYIRSMKEAGYTNLSNHTLIAMKAQGITADYIKSLAAMGYKKVSANELIGVKSQNITRDFIKSFEDIGYPNIPLHELIALKAMGVTSQYYRSFQDAGYKDLSLDRVIALKAQGITPEMIKEYKALGFETVSLDDIIGARATGVTPAFINSLRKKGYDLKSINKYVQLKAVVE